MGLRVLRRTGDRELPGVPLGPRIPPDPVPAGLAALPSAIEPPSPYPCDACDKRAWYSIVLVSIGFVVTYRACRVHAIQILREHDNVIGVNLIPEVGEWLTRLQHEGDGAQEE